jgi:hypothetical protein
LKQHKDCDAVLGEILGMIMSAEYVVDIMQDVHTCLQLNQENPKQLFLPRWGATFYTPIHINAKHLRTSLEIPSSQGVGVGVSPDGSWLHARRFPMKNGSVFRHQAIESAPVSGCLEFIDFAKDLSTQRFQERTYVFNSMEEQDLIVNGLGLWIWAGFDCGSRRMMTKTQFPYGCKFENWPSREEVKTDFSSYLDEVDKDSYAKNWRNVIMLFQKDLYVPRNCTLSIHGISDLRTSYQLIYSWQAQVLNQNNDMLDHAESQMIQPYHMYEYYER